MHKKWIALLLAGLVICNLSACGNGNSDQNISQGNEYSSTGDQGNQNTQASDKTNSASGLTSLIHRTGLFNRYCSTEDGFYYLTEEDSELADGSYAPHLMYMDYATCQEVYLCSDSSCQHNTEDCTSVLAGASSDGRIFIWDGYLYFLDRSPDTSGSTIINILGDSGSANVEADQAELYRMNLDGSERERIYSFDADATVEDVALGSDSGLYFVTKKLGASDSGSGTYTTTSDRQLICLNPNSGEAKSVCSLDFGDGLNWEIIGSSDDKVILKAYQYPDGMTEEEAAALDENSYLDLLKNSQIVYASLELSTGEKTQVYSQAAGGNSSSEAVLDGCLYASNESSQDIVKIDLATGEKSTLCSLENNYLYGTLGNYLCCTSHDLTADYGYYLVNVETGEISHCSLTNQALGWRLDLMTMAGDRALVVYDYEYTPLGDDSYDITRYQYGLISMDDLLNSVPNYTPIQMVGEGI